MAREVIANNQGIRDVHAILQASTGPVGQMWKTFKKLAPSKANPRLQGRLGGKFAIASPIEEDSDKIVEVDDDGNAIPTPGVADWAEASEELQDEEEAPDDELGESSASGGRKRKRGKRGKRAGAKNRDPQE